ncbi:MAG: hypothetical protein F4X64_09180 [Chloroflexi bacterium]|nr:hypothetical protein [Chloroflexota bacterium]
MNDQKTSEGSLDTADRLEPIRGKVARVISVRQVALNVGQSSGVEEGMLFDIVDPQQLEIRDPETNEMLGIIRPKAKARVRVFSVSEKFSLASTYRTESIGGLQLRGDVRMGGLLGRVETFRTRDSLAEAFSEEGAYVAQNDTVIQVINGT